jgi:two-component system, chemotaxis family, chemotaxis protein CheY
MPTAAQQDALPPRSSVLIVEDDPDALELLATILEDADYEVVRAANGLEALGKLADRRGRCDLILLDLMMPVMNGWDFRRKQLQIPALASIPVVLMSAGAHLAAASDGLDATGSVTKPVDTGDLIAIVRRHCPGTAARGRHSRE